MPRYNGGFIGTDGLDAPDAPVSVTPTAGDEQLSVAFTDVGGGTTDTTGFVVQVSTDGTDYSAGSATGSSSPIVVSSLTNGTSYTAKVWAINAHGTSRPSIASSAASPVPNPIGLVAGGEISSQVNNINFKDISSTGNFADFGDLTSNLYKGGAVSSATRAVFAHGNSTNVMSYVAPATTGDSTDFGDLSENKTEFGSLGNATRGLIQIGGGQTGDDEVEYITIASTGNSTNFGDMTEARQQCAGFASPTRGVAAVGQTRKSGGGGDTLRIDYCTIASTGNFIDFGNGIKLRNIDPNGCSSETRGVWGGGSNASGATILEYVTIASTGDATEFGDLNSQNNSYGPASCGSNTRGLWMGGVGWVGAAYNTVVYVTIASTGNAQDFGDLAYAPRYHMTACSTGHGGLQ